MNRRTVLGVLGSAAVSGLAGCLGGPRTTDSPTPSPTDTRTDPPQTVVGTSPGARTSIAPPATEARAVSLADVETAGLEDAFDVRAEVALTEDRITGDATARVRVGLHNRAAERRALTYLATECGANYLFGGREDGDTGLALVPEPHLEGGSTTCWRTGPETVVTSCGIPVTTNVVELAAGETVTWTFACLQSAGKYCLPPGRYRFERRFGSLGRGDDGAGSTLEGTTASLAFALDLAFD